MIDRIQRVLDNLAFAMNFSGDVPDHILEEIYGKDKIQKIRKMNEGVEDEHECESINQFNEEVSRKLDRNVNVDVLDDPESFFNEIVGYADIKKLLLRCIHLSEMEPVHVILDGPPASAKSMFLLQMQKKLKNVYYVDCTNATGPGMVDFLFDNDVRFLLLDEVEKMSRTDQNVLLNVMETGMLTSTKVRKTATKEMNLSIYATTNDIDAISKPFRSRFMEFSLPPYTYNEFCDIAVKLLGKRYNHNKEPSLKIADTIWNRIGSRDIRDLLQVGKLSKTIDDVDFVVDTLQKYKRKKGREDCGMMDKN